MLQFAFKICHINGQIIQYSSVKICLEPLYLRLVVNSLLPLKQTSICDDNDLSVKSKKGSGARENSNKIRIYAILISSLPLLVYKRQHIPIQLRHKGEKGTTPTHWGNMLLRELLNEKTLKSLV